MVESLNRRSFSYNVSNTDFKKSRETKPSAFITAVRSFKEIMMVGFFRLVGVFFKKDDKVLTTMFKLDHKYNDQYSFTFKIEIGTWNADKLVMERSLKNIAFVDRRTFSDGIKKHVSLLENTISESWESNLVAHPDFHDNGNAARSKWLRACTSALTTIKNHVFDIENAYRTKGTISMKSPMLLEKQKDLQEKLDRLYLVIRDPFNTTE